MEDDSIILPIDGVLDLHTFSPRDVKNVVADYIDECQRLVILEVRIIHGKGTGSLRRTVHAVLERQTNVSSFSLAPDEAGGWGATIVNIKPK